MNKNKQGFTLIELLVVIAIIAVLGAIVFVALDPATRFQDARDARRASDVVELLHAIKIDQVDNGGAYLATIGALTEGETYMIGTAASGCDDQDGTVTSDTHCVDLTGLVTEGYLGTVPVSPDGSSSWTESVTGYTIQRGATGIITVSASEAENTSTITASR